jgi:hypothetical protein
MRRRQQRAVEQMAPWQLSEALSEMAFPLNFDGFSKIVWRPMMRNRAAAAVDGGLLVRRSLATLVLVTTVVIAAA